MGFAYQYITDKRIIHLHCADGFRIFDETTMLVVV